MPKTYMQVTPETIEALKSNGFISVRMVPFDRENKEQATIELIPDKQSDFELGWILLNSKDIYDFIDGYSPMTKYIIDQKYLMEVNSV